MKNILLKTNLMVCSIIVIGFIITAVLAYQANYESSIKNIERVSSLSSHSIYYQMSSLLSKPVNISNTMANDSLLKHCLKSEAEDPSNTEYQEKIREYLNSYREKYAYESVFLVSSATDRYYNFNGINRIMEKNNPENVWYYDFMNSNEEYSLNVDNDEAANNEITAFINCRITGANGELLGIVGVGLRIDSIQDILIKYRDEFDVNTYFINNEGYIEISPTHTGYEHQNFFNLYDFDDDTRSTILNPLKSDDGDHIWINQKNTKSYIVAQYLDELSWHLIVERDTSEIMKSMNIHIMETILIIVLILLIILVIITSVIRRFNTQIMTLNKEKQAMFRSATEQMYENIYELNITQNRAEGENTERYFESLGVPKYTPFDEALKVIANKQIHEDYREEYIRKFDPKNIIHEYENKNYHLHYDFPSTNDGETYHWISIDTHIYKLDEDDTIRMFVYRKNIDLEKHIEYLSQTDEMTSILNKSASTRNIKELLCQRSNEMYALIMCDIDDFKFINDTYGHDFGDKIIIEFATRIKSLFDSDVIIGRIGGDEFIIFAKIENVNAIRQKVIELSKLLAEEYTVDSKTCTSSASIGVAIVPNNGTDFDTLYKNADTALYRTKRSGKNWYTFYSNH